MPNHLSLYLPTHARGTGRQWSHVKHRNVRDARRQVLLYLFNTIQVHGMT